MNIKEYISSGIIETCVLGLASREEMEEFNRLCSAHAEVREARNRLELSLENSIQQQAILPPSDLKDRIFGAMEILQNKGRQSGKPRNLTPSVRPSVRIGWLRYASAACLILLLGSTALNVYFFTQYKEYISRYDQLLASQGQLASLNRNLQTKMHDYQSALSMMKDPAMAVVQMRGTTPHASSMTTVYWDTHTKDVYLLVNELPKPSADQQYQLWAMVDGKPVDAGVFDMNSDISFVKMKNIPAAQAFAITLEKKGGNKTPTMNAMYVQGKVTG